MKLTGRLKEQVEQAKTKEEAKDLIAQVGMELTDEEMDQVAGGLVDGIDGVSMSESFREYRNN